MINIFDMCENEYAEPIEKLNIDERNEGLLFKKENIWEMLTSNTFLKKLEETTSETDRYISILMDKLVNSSEAGDTNDS